MNRKGDVDLKSGSMRMPFTQKTDSKRKFSLLLMLLLVSASFIRCSNAGPNETEPFFSGGEFVTRRHAIGLLSQAISIHVMQCPENHYAGLYTIGTVLGRELNSPQYKLSSINRCITTIIASPCRSPDIRMTEKEVVYDLYKITLRLCKPEKAAL